MAGVSTAITVLQSGAVADGNGTTSSDLTGYDGQKILIIKNGAGTATLTVTGCADTGFATQEKFTLGVTKLADSSATNTTRTVASGAISVAANTSYVYRIEDPLPYIRAVISSSSGLGAGTNETGLTATVYSMAE